MIKKLALFNPLQRSISVSSNACTHFKYTKNLQTNTPWDVSTLIVLSPSVSGISLSSKTPGGDLEDRRTLDRLFINLHLQTCSKHSWDVSTLPRPSPSVSGVLTGFFSTNHLEHFQEIFLRMFQPFKHNLLSLRIIPVLQDSIKQHRLLIKCVMPQT